MPSCDASQKRSEEEEDWPLLKPLPPLPKKEERSWNLLGPWKGGCNGLAGGAVGALLALVTALILL